MRKSISQLQFCCRILLAVAGSQPPTQFWHAHGLQCHQSRNAVFSSVRGKRLSLRGSEPSPSIDACEGRDRQHWLLRGSTELFSYTGIFYTRYGHVIEIPTHCLPVPHCNEPAVRPDSCGQTSALKSQ
ncbi:hypothetical protein BaRGS_00009997 [Batillaria attramentaria]|uniref:Ricin B lectin domain-containing protein n=1 Tax=Batillaria attramentaria TaxID=370345 RepID=A0ABD0LHF3_9CAEN